LYSEDDFQDIDELVPEQENRSILLIIGGFFSSMNRGIKPKKTKGKESWVFNYGFRIMRKGELHWKCNLYRCLCLNNMKIY
jgi:hypothetical protein